MRTSSMSRLGWTLGAVVLVVALAGSGLLSKRDSVLLDDVAQLAGGSTATAVCWWTARRRLGAERRWRLLMAIGMAGWTVGMVFWALYRSVLHVPLPSPSIADLGFFTLPLMALPALFVLTGETPWRAEVGSRHVWAVSLLDSAVIVGSMFVVAWATTLGAVVHAGAETTLGLVVAMCYPVTDFVMVTAFVGLWAMGRIPARFRSQTRLLGAGMVMLVLSDGAFAYLVASGATEIPTLADAGFIAGPVLIALAAATPTDQVVAEGDSRTMSLQRTHLVLPYMLVAVLASVATWRLVAGHTVDALTVFAGWFIVCCLLARQVLIVVENNALVRQISAAQAELTFRAHHDPLTGLANRALLDEKLDAALERHRRDGAGVALLVIDLDDFKPINDTLGHGVGDELLKIVGQRMVGCVRGSDTVARLGGDEFVVLLDTTTVTALTVMARIEAALAEPFAVDDFVLAVRASIGLAEADADSGESASDLIHRADSAMYEGKRSDKARRIRRNHPARAERT